MVVHGNKSSTRHTQKNICVSNETEKALKKNFNLPLKMSASVVEIVVLGAGIFGNFITSAMGMRARDRSGFV